MTSNLYNCTIDFRALVEELNVPQNISALICITPMGNSKAIAISAVDLQKIITKTVKEAQGSAPTKITDFSILLNQLTVRMAEIGYNVAPAIAPITQLSNPNHIGHLPAELFRESITARHGSQAVFHRMQSEEEKYFGVIGLPYCPTSKMYV